MCLLTEVNIPKEEYGYAYSVMPRERRIKPFVKKHLSNFSDSNPRPFCVASTELNF
jgi:hypothetical protein